MAPLDTEAQNSPEDQASPGHQAPPDTTDDSTEPDPAVSSSGPGTPPKKRAAPATPVDNQADGQSPDASPRTNDQHVDSFCSHLLKDGCEWFEKREDIDDGHLSVLQQVAALETYKNTENGFEFKVIFDDDNGKSRERTIQWQVLPATRDKAEREFISGRSRGFCQKDAAAIVALSALRGWESINVHGSQKQKDLLWLEAMKLGLKVKGHTPGPEALKEWQEQQATASTAGVTSADNEPSVTADNKGPATPPAAPSAPTGDNGTKQSGTSAQPAQSTAPATGSQQDTGKDSSVRSSVRGDLSGEFAPVSADSRPSAQPQPATPARPASRYLPGDPKSDSTNNNPSSDSSRKVGKHRARRVGNG